MVLKLATTIIIFSIFAFYLYQIKPMSEEAQNCFQNFSQMMKQTSLEKREDIQICSKNKEIILSLNNCLETVESKNISFPLFFKYPDVNANYDNTINRHNQICPAYPVSSIE